MEPQNSPVGLDLRPRPKQPVRLNRRASLAVGLVVLLVLLGFAYGGYKRRMKNETEARDATIPKSVGPATTAGIEFTKEVHQGQISRAEDRDQLTKPDGAYVGIPQERIVVRQAPPAPPPPPPAPPEPTPEERRLQLAILREQEARMAPTSVARTTSSTAAPPPPPSAQDDLNRVAALTKAIRAAEPPHTGRTAPQSAYVINAGWEIPAVLEQSLNSDLPGELKALVTSNVYDTPTGKYVLVPQGSRLVGKYDSHVVYAQDGVQVTWDRVIYPDGSSLDLGGMTGLDAHGNAGLRDQVDHHYKRLIGFAALTSLFNAGFAIAQPRNRSLLTQPGTGQLAAEGASRDLTELSAQVTRRNLNVPPTIKVPAGYKFTVRVNRDLVFDAPYEPATVADRIDHAQASSARK